MGKGDGAGRASQKPVPVAALMLCALAPALSETPLERPPALI